MICAYLCKEDFGANKEGDVIHMDHEKADSLVKAGMLEEAKAEDLQTDESEDNQGEAHEEDARNPEQNAALSKAVDRISRQLETSIANTMAKAMVSKNRAVPSVAVPAEPKQPVYKCLGEMLKDQWLVRKGNVKARNRLDEYAIRQKTSPLGANETTDSQGGYAIAQEWADKIFDKARSYPRLLDRCERVPLSGDTLNIPALSEASLADGVRHGGVLGYWLAEGNPATSSYPALGNVQAVLQTNVVFAFATLQLLEDSNIEPFDRFIARYAGLELVWQENQALISGPGTTAPVGILNQPALITVTHSSNDTNAMFGFDDLVKMYRALWSPCRSNAIWIVTPEAYNSLAQMTFINTAGTVTTYPAFGGISYNAADEIPMKVFGRPVIEWVGSPQVGSVGDIILVDPTQLTVAEKPQLFADMSSEYAFNTLQIAYRFYRRYDIRSGWLTSLESPDTHYSYSFAVALSSRGT